MTLLPFHLKLFFIKFKDNLEYGFPEKLFTKGFINRRSLDQSTIANITTEDQPKNSLNFAST